MKRKIIRLCDVLTLGMVSWWRKRRQIEAMKVQIASARRNWFETYDILGEQSMLTYRDEEGRIRQQVLFEGEELICCYRFDEEGRQVWPPIAAGVADA